MSKNIYTKKEKIIITIKGARKGKGPSMARKRTMKKEHTEHLLWMKRMRHYTSLLEM